MKCFLVLACLAFAGVAHAQAPCAAITEAKQKTYGFDPATLKPEEQQAKHAQIDSFWSLVKSHGAAGVACLRDLLAAEKNNGTFLFDGADLLHSLDTSAASNRVVVASLQRANLSHVNLAGYVHFALDLSQSGVDITPLAVRVIQLPDANIEIDIQDMAVNFDRENTSLFLFGTMPPSAEDKALIPLLKNEHPYVREATAELLAINMTPESFKALSEFKGMDALTKLHRDEVLSYRTYTPPAAAKSAPAFSREQVLRYLRLLPHNNQESAAAQKRQAEYQKLHAKPGASKGMVIDFNGPPFLRLSGYNAFIDSAMATLTEADLPLLRELRRKSIQDVSEQDLREFATYTKVIKGVIDRLDLYKEYRIHAPTAK